MYFIYFGRYLHVLSVSKFTFIVLISVYEKPNYNNNNIYLTAIGLSPGGSGIATFVVKVCSYIGTVPGIDTRYVCMTWLRFSFSVYVYLLCCLSLLVY